MTRGGTTRRVELPSGGRLGLLGTLCLAACASAPREAPAGPTCDRSGPEATIRAVIAADVRGDLEAMEDLYTADVVWLPPEGEPIAGRPEILARYREAFAELDFELECDVVQVAVTGDHSYVRGVTRGRRIERASGETTPVRDDFVAVLRREDGWRIACLAWSPSAEP